MAVIIVPDQPPRMEAVRLPLVRGDVGTPVRRSSSSSLQRDPSAAASSPGSWTGLGALERRRSGDAHGQLPPPIPTGPESQPEPDRLHALMRELGLHDPAALLDADDDEDDEDLESAGEWGGMRANEREMASSLNQHPLSSSPVAPSSLRRLPSSFTEPLPDALLSPAGFSAASRALVSPERVPVSALTAGLRQQPLENGSASQEVVHRASASDMLEAGAAPDGIPRDRRRRKRRSNRVIDSATSLQVFARYPVGPRSPTPSPGYVAAAESESDELSSPPLSAGTPPFPASSSGRPLQSVPSWMAFMIDGALPLTALDDAEPPAGRSTGMGVGARRRSAPSGPGAAPAVIRGENSAKPSERRSGRHGGRRRTRQDDSDLLAAAQQLGLSPPPSWPGGSSQPSWSLPLDSLVP